jgi:hypothetical protein
MHVTVLGCRTNKLLLPNSYVVTRLLFSKFCREGAAGAARAFGREEGYQMEGRGNLVFWDVSGLC